MCNIFIARAVDPRTTQSCTLTDSKLKYEFTEIQSKFEPELTGKKQGYVFLTNAGYYVPSVLNS
jgi:hypothetical protein